VISDEALAAQVKETVCDPPEEEPPPPPPPELGGTALAVKFTPPIFAPFIDSDAVDGENVSPGWLGATRYEPFFKPEKL